MQKGTYNLVLAFLPILILAEVTVWQKLGATQFWKLHILLGIIALCSGWVMFFLYRYLQGKN